MRKKLFAEMRKGIPAKGLTTLLSLVFLGQMLSMQSGLALGANETKTTEMLLEEMNLKDMSLGFAAPHAACSLDGHALKIGGKEYKHGIGTLADSEILIDLKGAATRFRAEVGVDDEVGKHGTVVFSAIVDGKKVFDSLLMRGGEPAKVVDLNLRGARLLELDIVDAGEGIEKDHADWADATLTLSANAGEKPASKILAASPAPQIAGADGKEPALHGPRITGTTPGNPFLYKVPFTGEGDVAITAGGLPEGLSIDRAGIITGSVKTAGTYHVELTATSSLGKAHRRLTIVAQDHKLALTPPLGWNSWNVWAGAVDAEKVRAAADSMLKCGLAAKGFSYVNIDDTWEGAARAADGQVTTNEKFSNMKALSDYVHSKGLKLGIYSSPGPQTCAGFVGSYKHEDQDAATYADWGMDYLKYDWCSYGDIDKSNTLEGYKKPYIVMHQALNKTKRDIVYSLCQYGMGDVWKWGGSTEVGGNCWRTSGDIIDTWSSLSHNGFDVMRKSMVQHSCPGHYNDPDMLVVGRVGWGSSQHPTRLTPDEQLTHITLWSMAASPLLIGCDMTQMDKFTHDLLTNTEVLDIDQDPLVLPVQCVANDGTVEVWARKLYDGTVAVACFNKGKTAQKAGISWSDLSKVAGMPANINGKQPVRDLWKRQNLGQMARYQTTLPRHGTVLLKVGTPQAI